MFIVGWLIFLTVIFLVVCVFVEPIEPKKHCCLHDNNTECRKFNRHMPKKRGFKIRDRWGLPK